MARKFSIRSHRGFALNDFPGTFGFALVKAGIDSVTPVVAELHHGKPHLDVYGKCPLKKGDYGLVVHQYTGHAWTIVQNRVRSLAEAFSKACGAPTISWIFEDVSGWQEYVLFEEGKVVEEFLFGYDYSEEVGDAARHPAGNWQINESDGDNQYLYASTSKKRTATEVMGGERFLDQLMKEQDASLPPLKYFPDFIGRPIKVTGLTSDDFVRVDLIEVSISSGASCDA